MVRALVSSLLLAFSISAMAGSVSLFPTTIFAVPGEKSAALTLENKGNQPERYQVAVFAWAQSPEGLDVTSPTRDLLAAPSVIEVPAKSKRAVRVVRLQGQGSAGYYRLVLRQLPKPKEPGQVGMQVLVDQNLPVAFEDSKAGHPVLAARYTAQGVLLTNTGPTAARLTAIGAAGQPEWRTGALGWVLPGQSKLVELQPGQKSASLTITVNGKPVTVTAN